MDRLELIPRRDGIVARGALGLGEADIGDTTIFLAHLPWSWPLFRQLINHLIAQRPLWTLAPARFAHAARPARLISHCSHILCVPRLKFSPKARMPDRRTPSGFGSTRATMAGPTSIRVKKDGGSDRLCRHQQGRARGLAITTELMGAPVAAHWSRVCRPEP